MKDGIVMLLLVTIVLAQSLILLELVNILEILREMTP